MARKHPRISIGAVLLAAGAGSRMGGRPKALLELEGHPLVVRQLNALSSAGVDELVIVLGTHAERIRPLIEHMPITVVRNPRPDDGQVSSQRLGLGALSTNVEAVLVALVDQPLIDRHDIVSMICAFKKRADGTSIVVPHVAGQPGNPVIFSASVREQILQGDVTLGCREWRSQNPAAVVNLDTDNRHFVLDVDSPQDIERFERDTGRSLRWPESEMDPGW
jgi:molybdenum cofactor cytidylyltransferase